jgi:hypothetical protein
MMPSFHIVGAMETHSERQIYNKMAYYLQDTLFYGNNKSKIQILEKKS